MNGPLLHGSLKSKVRSHQKLDPENHDVHGIDEVHAHKVVHKLDLEKEDFGHDVGLRPVSKMDPTRVAPCVKRKDGLFACLPDVYWIGVSKSGTTSIAQYLHYHPMIRNLVGENRSSTTHSKEGHFWEVSEQLFSSPEQMINSRIKAMHKSQDGLETLENRPIFIEYTPNYLVLDHIPKLISQGFKHAEDAKLRYTPKFIISLRDPVSRTLSSWRFKALEYFQMQERRMMRTGKPIELLLLNDSIHWGEMRTKCISDCYKKKNSMIGCNINKCRKEYDKDSQETVLHYQKGEISMMCCKTSYYAHIVKSLYAYQIAKWLTFFDKSNFFIYTLEDFAKNRCD